MPKCAAAHAPPRSRRRSNWCAKVRSSSARRRSSRRSGSGQPQRIRRKRSRRDLLFHSTREVRMARMNAVNDVARLFDKLAPVAAPEDVRIAEAIVFASADPVQESAIASRLSNGADVRAVMEELGRLYAGRGVNLVRVAHGWAFRTAEDLSWLLV